MAKAKKKSAAKQKSKVAGKKSAVQKAEMAKKKSAGRKKSAMAGKKKSKKNDLPFEVRRSGIQGKGGFAIRRIRKGQR
ncbi:hypothetical protein GF356_04635, partial [candidate division GN15 bacterium]|nr:hypothetical protein [candidate division GN15 bacterium]